MANVTTEQGADRSDVRDVDRTARQAADSLNNWVETGLLIVSTIVLGMMLGECAARKQAPPGEGVGSAPNTEKR